MSDEYCSLTDYLRDRPDMQERVAALNPSSPVVAALERLQEEEARELVLGEQT
jgi:hypothetical protein